MREHTESLMNYLNNSMRQLKTRLSCSAGTIENVQSLDYAADSGDTIAIGNTVSASISVKCVTPAFGLTDRDLIHSFGAPDSETDEQIWTQMGVFKVTELESRMGITSFKAYDRMYTNTREEYKSQITYPAAMQAVLNEVCAKCGFTAPAITANPTLQGDVLSGYTLREVIGFIAGYQGKNAFIDSEGKLIFKLFSACTYTADDHTANVPYADERNIVIYKLICSTGNETLQSGNGPEGIIFNNPLMTQERLDEILTTIKDFSYRKLEADIPVGNYLIESGDIIKVTSGGSELTVPVMSLSYHYDGGISCKLSSYGAPDTVTKSISAKRFQDTQKIRGLRKEIADATSKITGAEGGYLRIEFGDDGKTAELLIMDTPDTATAVNVWRFNKNGLGHSHNGYEGPFDDVALTSDGTIVADRIAGNQIAGVVIKTASPNDHPHSYVKFEEGGVGYYTSGSSEQEGQAVGSLIEVWEGEGESTAGIAWLTDKSRWLAIGDYEQTGWSSSMEYRPYQGFIFDKDVQFNTVRLRNYGSDDEYINLMDTIHELQERVRILEEALGGIT